MPCSRWRELVESIRFHAEVSRLADAHTEFRLAGQTTIDKGVFIVGNQSKQQYDKLQDQLDEAPCGGSYLCYHIDEIVAQLQQLKSSLIRRNEKVTPYTTATFLYGLISCLLLFDRLSLSSPQMASQMTATSSEPCVP